MAGKGLFCNKSRYLCPKKGSTREKGTEIQSSTIPIIPISLLDYRTFCRLSVPFKQTKEYLPN